MSDNPKFKVFANTTNPEGSESVEQFLGYVDSISVPTSADKTVVIDSVPDHLFPHQRKTMEFLQSGKQVYVQRVLPDGHAVVDSDADKERGITLWGPKTLMLDVPPNMGKTLSLLAAKAITNQVIHSVDEAPFWPKSDATGAWPNIEEFRLSAKEVEELRGLSTSEGTTTSGFHVKDLTKLGYGKFPNASMRPGENIPATKPVRHDKVRARAKAAKVARKRNRRK